MGDVCAYVRDSGGFFVLLSKLLLGLLGLLNGRPGVLLIFLESPSPRRIRQIVEVTLESNRIYDSHW